MKSILFALSLLSLSSEFASANEIKVTCNPTVSRVWIAPKSKFEKSGVADSQHMMLARTRFPSQRIDRLSVDEIKSLTSKETEGGVFLNGERIESEFPILTFSADSDVWSDYSDEVLAFSNVENPKSELEKGNYLQLRGYRTWFGDEKNVAIVIHGVVYRGGKPQIGHSISMSVLKSENVIESVQHPLAIQQEFATRLFLATSPLKGMEKIEELGKISSPFYEAMGHDTIESLTLDCSFVN